MGGTWGREDRGDPFGVANFPSITEAKAAAKRLLKDDAVRAVDADGCARVRERRGDRLRENVVRK